MSTKSPAKTAELYVRSLAPQGLQSTHDTVIGRLEELKSDGTIDDFTVVVWGNRLLPESSAGQTTTGQRLQETVEEFRQWAAGSGMSLESAFPTETIRSAVTEEEYTCIRFPMLTLAEYQDGTLQFVSPCRDEDTRYTIHDRLNALEATREVSNPSPSIPAGTAADSEGKSHE